MNGKNISDPSRRELAEIVRLCEEREHLMKGPIDDAVARRIVEIGERLLALRAGPQ